MLKRQTMLQETMSGTELVTRGVDPKKDDEVMAVLYVAEPAASSELSP